MQKDTLPAKQTQVFEVGNNLFRLKTDAVKHTQRLIQADAQSYSEASTQKIKSIDWHAVNDLFVITYFGTITYENGYTWVVDYIITVRNIL
jgi:hypothetical protein